jgi:large subunit ribosomal protein L4
MPVVDVMNLDGKTVGQVELSDEVFAARINPHLLHETVRHYLNAARAGTHKTKDKSEVSGAGRKLWRQKGTGRARIGSIRSPLWRHGGTVHGPRPRSYDYVVPRQMLSGGLRSALSAKFADEKMTVVDTFTLDSHKTQALRAKLDILDGDSRTVLIVDTGENVNLERASRNLEGVKLVPTTALEPYDLLRHERLVISRPAAEKLSRSLRVNKTPDPNAPVQIQGAPETGKPGAAKAEAKPAAHAAKKKAAPKPVKSTKKAAATKASAKPKKKKGKKD